MSEPNMQNIPHDKTLDDWRKIAQAEKVRRFIESYGASEKTVKQMMAQAQEVRSYTDITPDVTPVESLKLYFTQGWDSFNQVPESHMCISCEEKIAVNQMRCEDCQWAVN